ncbi:MAG: hypothetical protein CMJ24_00920 [Phycisphaerae bacterium]|nr:hypothetical protein [Phycisphaerae bacterium]
MCLRPHRNTSLSLITGLLAILFMGATHVCADAPEVERRLNDRLFSGSTETGRSIQPIITAYLTMTPSPVPVGDDFNLTTIWPGMAGWGAVSKWAAANEQMGAALLASQDKPLLGMPYGRSNVPSSWSDAGIVIDVAPGKGLSSVSYDYLDGAMDTILCWATAEFYRLLEAEKYEEAFELAIAYIRLLRQGGEQEMIREKLWFLDSLSYALSTQRDAMFAYLDRIPAALFKKLGTKDYPFINMGDDQRMRRLAMPEGDRIFVEYLLEESFDRGGQADQLKFAEIFGELQARETPLDRFGTKKRWERLATLHGSLDASKEKLTEVYDDWWRRWRSRQFEEIMNLPTAYSRLNEVRFAAVQLAVRDLEEVFRAREQLITNINGTIFSAGLCGYKKTFGDWPRDFSGVYSVYSVKRFDFDPYDSDYGGLTYKKLSSKKTVESPYGQLRIDGCMLYVLGSDHIDDQGAESTNDGAVGDIIVWPPLRQLARDAKLID